MQRKISHEETLSNIDIKESQMGNEHMGTSVRVIVYVITSHHNSSVVCEMFLYISWLCIKMRLVSLSMYE